jgi:hypothetical protein
MTEKKIADNLAPEEMVQAALTKGRTGFVLLYGDTQFLLVRLDGSDGELAGGLATTVPKGNGGSAIKPSLTNINYHTEILSNPIKLPMGRGAPQDREIDATALRDLILTAPHFVVPLRKRADADVLYVDRISVGRARNKDIVLRDAIVSKFHAWFQIDDTGHFCVADAGSKNGTRVDEDLLPARELRQLTPGAKVKIGTVEAVLCSAELFWSALHAPASQARIDKMDKSRP